MPEEPIRDALRQAPLPDEAGAEERGLRVVRAEYAAQASLLKHPSRSRRLALAVIGTLIGFALVLSPVGAEVRAFVDDVVGGEAQDPPRALTRIPGGGELLVESAAGVWIVRPDGSQRLLGDYEQATWSPQGLFVAVTDGNRLSAVDPLGEPRWTVTRTGSVHDPRWSHSGYRVAYRSGSSLRVVAGDGTGDRLLDAGVSPVPAAWRPGARHVLAYVDADGRARVLDTDTNRQLFATGPGESRAVVWSGDGARLAVWSPVQLLLFDGRGRPLGGVVRPPGARLAAAAFQPGTHRLAVIWRYVTGPRRGSSEVVVASPGRQHPLFGAPGTLRDLQWSPGGERVLVSRPAADEWIFASPSREESALRAGDITGQFAPGTTSTRFPGVAGWVLPQR